MASFCAGETLLGKESYLRILSSNCTIISGNLSKIKKLIFSDVTHCNNLISVYFDLLEEIKTRNFTALEEVEIQSIYRYNAVDNENVIGIKNYVIQQSKEYSSKFNVTLRIRCCLKRRAEGWKLKDFYEEFKGFKLTKLKNGYQEFSKTCRISPKITYISVIGGKFKFFYN